MYRTIALCVGAVFALAGVQAGELTITFIGNEAFHITDGETTLLSDFPYRSGAYGYMAYDLKDVPPIVDGLSLITHVHTDHWVPKLFESMDLSVVGPLEVTAKLDPKRIVPISASGTARFKDIQIQAIETPHKFTTKHFSYLVTWHGLRLYFPGDTETPVDILWREYIDVMFITPWLVRTVNKQYMPLDVEHLVVYHQKKGEAFPQFQNIRRMKQGESFKLPFRDPVKIQPADR